MKTQVTPLASNVTQVTTQAGNRVIYSYCTPVAIEFETGPRRGQRYRTAQVFSATTRKHLARWAQGNEQVSGCEFAALLEEA
jgi:hypothetical protein